MNFRSKITAALLAVLATAALTGCAAQTDSALQDRVTQLEQENARLRQELVSLHDRVEALENRGGLQEWSLTGAAWDGGSGATITFTATPGEALEGQSAQLLIRLEGQDVDSIPCIWDGSCYTASAQLSAADGYGYYCVLSAGDGTLREISLNTPENLTDETLVYLETSLSAYCNMTVDDWTVSDGLLTITEGYIQAQLPRLSAEGTTAVCTGARLWLERNGEVLESVELELPAGEGEGSYEKTLSDAVFVLPELADDQQLELYLQITLSDGQILTTVGGSWFYYDGELMLVVG